jgi:uncharacterized protein (DUF58 family)
LTARATALAAGGTTLVAVGWWAGWPELTCLGAGALALIAAATLLTGPSGRVDVRVMTPNLAVRREQPAVARVVLVGARRRRSLRLVEGTPASPRRTLPVPAGTGLVTLELPLDTSRRGEHAFGPFTLVRGDPWSVFRRSAGTAPVGRLLVLPRTLPVRGDLLRSLQVGEAGLRSVQRGDDDFFALRDYVWGDEPRDVHWRSSARSGRLVVKQRVAAAAQSTMFVLDCEASAYASADAFGEGFLAERFESAVEVTASLLVARRRTTPKVALTTTGIVRTIPRRITVEAQLEALAVVREQAPADCAPEQLPAMVRRAECPRVVVVTGTPSARLIAALSRVRQHGVAVTVIRVAAELRGPMPDVEVMDVATAEDLA